MPNDGQISFGLMVIGDEILSGKRRDTHMDHFRTLLLDDGFGLAWQWVLPDEPNTLEAHLRLSMARSVPVFVCGGIGATPDDHTRACAASAAGVGLIRHPLAVREIEARFGAEAYPHRILMADLPEGCELIPNPKNRIPGFSIRHHHFLPGFPEMAWPMAEWVLHRHFAHAGREIAERSVRVFASAESSLLPLMQSLTDAYPRVKLFSLPHMGDDPHIELGFRGAPAQVDSAYQELCRRLRRQGLSFAAVQP